MERVAAYFAAAEEARWFSNGGPCHRLLVQRLEALLTPARCVPVANCTLALMIGLRALTEPVDRRRRKVLMPSFTFAATANAVVWAGLQPVFLDVDAAAWHLDPGALERALARHGETVAAVLACSTFGVPPPIGQRTAWESATRAAGVPLLIDSAAGFGAVAQDGQRLGSQGDIEVFSFHATKPFAIGEGGLAATEDPRLAQRLAKLANFGFENGVVDAGVGLNAKLSEWSAATALAVLDGYDDVIARRRAAAAQIWARLEGERYRRQAGSENGVWQFVPALAESPQLRVDVLQRAARDGIELRSYFSEPLHRMPAFAAAEREGTLATTDYLADRIVSLPMANDLRTSDIEAIAGTLRAAANSRG